MKTQRQEFINVNTDCHCHVIGERSWQSSSQPTLYRFGGFVHQRTLVAKTHT